MRTPQSDLPIPPFAPLLILLVLPPTFKFILILCDSSPPFFASPGAIGRSDCKTRQCEHAIYSSLIAVVSSPQAIHC